eukprot:9489828-Ditylum_brightwellii.AAC.2
MECTNHSMDQGKWFFIVSKANQAAAVAFLDAQAIDSYANVLMGLAHASPQEDDDKELHTNPLCARKHAAVALSANADTPATSKSQANPPPSNPVVTMEVLEHKLAAFCTKMEEVQDRKLKKMRTQLEEQLLTKIANIMENKVSQMHTDMKTMLENNMTATITMIQAPISTAFRSITQGVSSPSQTALGFYSVEQSSAPDVTEK